MADSTFTDSDSRSIRAQWFKYLDSLEPLQGPLHSYCLRLTNNIWDAEDLVQETLLRGFAMVARGDLHGELSRVRNTKAYLFRTATNHWLDIQRKRGREVGGSIPEAAAEDTDRSNTPDAVEKAMALTSPQEFVAILLKDVYDFSIDEIADFIGTTIGTVKSALSRARRKMRDAAPHLVVDPQKKMLVVAFVEAINDQDLDRVMQLMSETLHIVVCNVGGGRGRRGVWTKASLSKAKAEYAEHHGEPLIVLRWRESGVAYDVIRVDGSSGTATKIIDYCYAVDTLRHIADALKIPLQTSGYHQTADTIKVMIETTELPWQSE